MKAMLLIFDKNLTEMLQTLASYASNKKSLGRHHSRFPEQPLTPLFE